MGELALSTSTIKNWAVIENGKVVNKILADSKFANKFYPGSIDLTDFENHPDLGDFWDGNVFTPKPVIDETLAE